MNHTDLPQHSNDEALNESNGKPTLLSSWLGLFSHPASLWVELQEAQACYLASRPWSKLLLTSSYCLAILAAPLILILGGLSVPKNSLTNHYQKIAQYEDESVSSPGQTGSTDHVNTSPEIIKTTDFGLHLHERISLISDRAFHSTFIVSLQYLEMGKVDQAKLLMQRIAPRDRAGYPPAHAWLAHFMISDRAIIRPSKELIHHLQHSMSWSGTTPRMRQVLAVYLESTNKIDQALDLLKTAAEQDPVYVNALVAMAMKHDKYSVYETFVEQMQDRLKTLCDEKLDDMLPFTTRIELYLLTAQPDEAMNILTQARKQHENPAHWNRMESEIWRWKYHESRKQRPDGSTAPDMFLLNAALEADPSNPKLEAELNNLAMVGEGLTEDMKRHLHATITQGKATPLTHFILGNEAIRADNLEIAKTHFEIAYNLAPNSPIILNNLAFALLKSESPDLQRAEKLIDQAVQIAGTISGIRKTQAQIKLQLSKNADAVATLEKAISLAPNDLSLRELLVQAYRRAGLEDLANLQELSLQETSSRKSPKPRTPSN